MARAKNTLGADMPGVESPKDVPSEHHDRPVHDPEATPKSTAFPSDKMKDAIGTETLRTTAGSTETSSSINTGRSNRAADHEQEHAVNCHGSLPSRQTSPLPTAGAEASVAEMAAEALDAVGVPDAQDLSQSSIAGHNAAQFTVVISDSDDKIQDQVGQGSADTEPARQRQRGTRQHGPQKGQPQKIHSSKQESNNEDPNAHADADVARFDQFSIHQSARVAVPQAATAPRTSAEGKRKSMGGNTATKKRKKVSDPSTQDVRYGKRAFETATGSRSTGAVQSKGIHMRRVDVAFRESSIEAERRDQSGDDLHIASPDSLRHHPTHRDCDDGTAQKRAIPCTTIGANGSYNVYRNDADEISGETQKVEVPTPKNRRSTTATETSRFVLSNANLQITTPDGDGSVKVEIEGHWNIKFVDKPVPFPSRGSPSTIWVSPMRPLHP
ncbi:uncharacterized protein BBA_10185 [Beauveria bassiana ARSEF 2860]|uniref:Uncharacterized protein n=1 Tax=Beauveria bassiana (strain ARSEF 2860) TaxID=655819 RepID=J4KKQ5_BEAB2|nr:uncharacterized protein BBA_10185 [Beauveria bassiana ARSEF 2860]EJP60864.1 hypothetical protein BBA_10185 [Beauveria bassiana ARSEF 2860]